jgi:hypothetical protein
MERQELIELCKDAVVHHTKWRNRDSYSAQKSLQSIYEGLTAGLDYRIVTKEIDADYHSDERTLVIEFLQPIDLGKLKTGQHLEISSRDDYWKDCDPEYEGEMFDGDGIDFESSYTQTYMPTRKRIEECGIGNDWY